MRARDNPLTVQRLQALRYRLDEVGRRALLDAFAAHGRRGAVVGPQGHGKTTLLRDLHAHFAAEGWEVRAVRLRRAQGRFDAAERELLRRAPHARVLLSVDGVDQLAALERWRLRRWARDAGGLLVAAHREGYLPTVWRCRTSPALLCELLVELGLTDEATVARACALHAALGGNLREVFSTLYDDHARMPDPPSPAAETGARAVREGPLPRRAAL